MVICSRCGEMIESGQEYRWHFDKHLDEYDMAIDKQLYIQQTTNIAGSRVVGQINDNSRSNSHSTSHRINNTIKIILRRLNTIIKTV